jgi:hypothetical protein
MKIYQHKILKVVTFISAIAVFSSLSAAPNNPFITPRAHIGNGQGVYTEIHEGVPSTGLVIDNVTIWAGKTCSSLVQTMSYNNPTVAPGTISLDSDQMKYLYGADQGCVENVYTCSGVITLSSGPVILKSDNHNYISASPSVVRFDFKGCMWSTTH